MKKNYLEATTQHKQSDALPKNKVCQNSKLNFYNEIDVSVLNKYYNYEYQYRFFFSEDIICNYQKYRGIPQKVET